MLRTKSYHSSGQYSATSRRTSSADAYSPMNLQRTDSGVVSSEVQTKHILQQEIAARQRVSAVALKRNARSLHALFPNNPENDGETGRKLFMVCDYLPFTVYWKEDAGTFRCQRDPFEANFAELLEAEVAGRLEGPAGLRPSQVVLVGAPTVRRESDGAIVPISETLQQELNRYLRSEMKVVPVFPPPNLERFADLVLFPLLHYTPPSMETGLGLYDWSGFEKVNESFRDAVLQEYSRGDLVWINDYPLMLLPKMLRKERPDICIGFYIHCVFPSSEVYRMLPQREHLLRGVLSSNLIGFHNFQYVRHFLTACTRILGLECTSSGIEACEDAGGTHTKVIAVPLGINLEPYRRILSQEETKARTQQFRQTFSNLKLLVARDRLEEKKGIPHKIMAFHKFLQKAPHWAKQCVFVQIVEADPAEAGEESGDSGTAYDEQQRLLQQVYQMVGEVNSTFGSIGHLPFHFLCQTFNRVDVAALTSKANVFIDTPLRDTLSASAHEFLLCQEERECGVLIMSEFSGSAQSLRAGSICVNPWDTNGFADAIQEALEMDSQDRIELHRYGHRHVVEHTLGRWALNFCDELLTAESECEDERLQIPPPLDHEKTMAALRKVQRRIVILGFAGTLLPRQPRIHAKILPKLSAVLHANLQVISEDPNTHVIILSGMERSTLDQAFSSLPNLWIIGEGGICYRKPNSQDWYPSMDELKNDESKNEWLQPVKNIMEYFADRTPGSTVIETSCSVSWHYQKTQGDHAAIQSKDLLIHLWAGPLLSAPAEVVVGNDSVTVRPTGVGKASRLEELLQQICCEEGSTTPKQEWQSCEAAIVCISDLITRDEDVFMAVHKFFEDERKGSKETQSRAFTKEGAGDRGTESWESSVRWHPGITEREPQGAEEMNLEANSKSLGDIFSRLNMVAHKQLELDDSGPFGLYKTTMGFGPAARTSWPGTSSPPAGRAEGSHSQPLLHGFPNFPKAPSEPDLKGNKQSGAEAIDEGGTTDWEGGEESKAVGGNWNQVQLFTCTVSRKPTRAMYHLSDHCDVAFFIARFAREIRQAKQATESENASSA